MARARFFSCRAGFHVNLGYTPGTALYLHGAPGQDTLPAHPLPLSTRKKYEVLSQCPLWRVQRNLILIATPPLIVSWLKQSQVSEKSCSRWTCAQNCQHNKQLSSQHCQTTPFRAKISPPCLVAILVAIWSIGPSHPPRNAQTKSSLKLSAFQQDTGKLKTHKSTRPERCRHAARVSSKKKASQSHILFAFRQDTSKNRHADTRAQKDTVMQHPSLTLFAFRQGTSTKKTHT